MKKSILIIAAFAAAAFTVRAATPEQEKAFTDGYRKALEAGDAKTLASFLLTDGASAETVEFFKMMQALEPGAKITSLELVKIEAEDAKKFEEEMTMPDGKKYKLPVKPSKILVIKTETKTADGSSSDQSQIPVAEKGGKIIIPIPVPVK